MMQALIYHNPDCGTSRNALALMRQAGVEPQVVEYLETPPSRDEIRQLATRMGFGLRDLLRRKGAPFAELGLGKPELSDDDLLDAIEAHPILLNRPIVVTDKGVMLCRPSETVLDLLPAAPQTPSNKDDGSPFLIDSEVAGDNLGELRAALAGADLPADDLSEPGRRFFSYRTLQGDHVGFAGFERYGSDALLRSILINPEQRGRGLGGNVTQLLLSRAFNDGARNAYLLTTTAGPFFERVGFKKINREYAPASIQGTRQASALCPSTAPLLAREITL